MRYLFAIVAMMLASAGLVMSAAAKPPMEAYGDMPQSRGMQLSPDGKKIVYIQRLNGEDILIVYDVATSTARPLARIGLVRARAVQFLGNNYVVVRVSEDKQVFGISGKRELSSAFAFNINTGSSVELLRNTMDRWSHQAGSGPIIGMDPNGQNALMATYMGQKQSTPTWDVLSVPLDTGRGTRVAGAKGFQNVISWILNADGRVTLREDYNSTTKTHMLFKREANGDWKKLYQEEDVTIPTVNFVGVSPDGKTAYAVSEGEEGFSSLFTVSMDDGKIEGPVKQRTDAEIEGVVADLNGVVYGVVYSGLYTSYDMFDEGVQRDIEGVTEHIGSANVHLTSWSSDWSKLLFYATGGNGVERYMLYDRTARQLKPISNARPEIKQQDIGEVTTIEYKARDGLAIPALVTWPAGVPEAERKKLPLVVMPHGGPEAYDAVGFDWLAQFIANEGYAVLQPNFRGSAGFGQAFRLAGHGEWGRKMQDDITDGVNALVKMGWADPERLCIVGWSYGGYAALAGGTVTPDLYKCVAAVAGVSNLGAMIEYERQTMGTRSLVVQYWQKLIGNLDKDRAAVDAVSPALKADKFAAPVLLVHGTADTVVPVWQSETMNDALVRAGKPVQFIRIDGDDHSLVEDDSRRQALKALGDFLRTHIGQ